MALRHDIHVAGAIFVLNGEVLQEIRNHMYVPFFTKRSQNKTIVTRIHGV